MNFNDFILITLAALATYRLSLLITRERGLFGVFAVLRVFTGKKAGTSNGARIWVELAELVRCPHCMGVWVAAVLALALYGLRPLTLLVWLGVAGVQSFMTALSEGEHGE